MPLLAILYVLSVCLLAFGTFSTQLKERKPLWYISLNLSAVAIMLLMFTGYWIRSLVETIGLFAPCLLLFSLVWEICTAREVVRGIERVGQDAPAEARSMAKRLGMGLEILFCGIGYWFGGIAALRTI